MKSRDPLDVVFFHVGKGWAARPSIIVPPMGLTALADYLRRSGLRVRIFNYWAEKVSDPAFEPAVVVERHGAKVACLDLHWHAQSAAVLAVARRLKHEAPELKIVLGGITAGVFHEEILAAVPEVDAVIRGEAEVPLERLCRAWTRGEPAELGRIPNLTWRAAAGAIVNPDGYSTPEKLFRELDFARFDLFSEASRYFPDSCEPPDAGDSQVPTFYYSPGRGCFNDCAICGGARSARPRGRSKKALLTTPALAAATVLRAARQGFLHWHMELDRPALEPFYLEVFARLRRSPLSLSGSYGCWRTPSRGFLAALKETFTAGAKLELTPWTGSESVRRKCFPHLPGDEEFMRALKDADAAGLECDLFFTPGLPCETRSDIAKTRRFIRVVRETWPRVRVCVAAVALDPASPAFRAPERFGLGLRRRTFADFVRDSACAETPGYRTRSFTEREILDLAGGLASAAR